MISLLVESTVRSLAFAGAIGLALEIGRVRDVGTRLAAWTCVLYGALLLPLAVPFLPPLAVHMPSRAANQKVIVLPATSQRVYRTAISMEAPRVHFDWRTAGVDLYLAVALGLLGRLAFGLFATRRLRRTSRPVSDARLQSMLRAQGLQAGIKKLPELAESSALAVPITIGWVRASVILAASWGDGASESREGAWR